MTDIISTIILAIIIIIVSVLTYLFLVSGIIRTGKRGTSGWIAVTIAAFLGLLLLIYLAYNIMVISPSEWAQIVLTLGLVAVTGLYASSASKQADASVKMAEEMREQRIIESRPIIIQKALIETETIYRNFGSKDWFSYFEIYNAGNGPAIEVEISLMNSEKTPIRSQRKSFLRAGETPIVFEAKELSNFEESTFYLTSEYKSILSTTQQPTWYQTWLPFKTSKASEKGRIYVIPGELEFREVSEKDRIDAFSSRSKPK